MPTATYDLISEQVLGSNTASITFSSISGTYKDLVLEITNINGSITDGWLRFNSDTASNYSRIYLFGNGSTASSGRNTSVAFAYGILGNTSWTTNYANIMSYANTNMNKTILFRSGGANDSIAAAVDLWRSTAAITAIEVGIASGTYSTGSTFRLWGVAG